MINERIKELREDLIKSTQEILKIKSLQEEAKEGMPFGEGIGNSLNCALDIGKRLGFKTVNLDGYVGYIEYGEGEEYVAVLGHLDVVPEGDGWSYPPYGAEIHDNKIYARGALDDKGPMIAALYGLKAIKDSALPLSKKVRIIFGTDEETGSGGDIEYYLQREKPPVLGFTPDADYPVIYAEKGLTIFDLVQKFNSNKNEKNCIKYISGGQRPNVVPDLCEIGIISKNIEEINIMIQKFKENTGYELTAEQKEDMVIVRAFGKAAHGSTPELGKNAIMILFSFLETLDIGESEVADFISFLNKYVGMESDGKSFGVGLEDEASGKLSFNIGTVEMNKEKIVMKLNLRYPVTYRLEDMVNPFKERLNGTTILIENMEHQGPLYFPKDHILITSLQKVYTDQTGQEAKLVAIGGGTYAKSMPNVVAFGPLFPGKPDVIHQVDEYIEVEELIMNAQIYGHAIYELAK